eukprot:sb/3472225/
MGLLVVLDKMGDVLRTNVGRVGVGTLFRVLSEVLVQKKVQKYVTLKIRSAMSLEKEKQSLRCGLLNIRPDFLQKFNSAKWFFAFFCLAFLVHHMTNTMISVNLSTIEKQFELSSTKSSFIINAYDISCALTVMFISHFCRHNKPKWIGLGIIVMGVGALIFTIPHLTET